MIGTDSLCGQPFLQLKRAQLKENTALQFKKTLDFSELQIVLATAADELEGQRSPGYVGLLPLGL